MHWFWPFPTPQVPDSILSKFKEIAEILKTAVETAYWLGVKDGVVVALILVVSLYVLFAKERQ